MFYQWAIRQELTDTDPTVRVPRPRLHRLLPRPIPDHELERALRAGDPRMRAILGLAAYAGLRRSELARVEREHLGADLSAVFVADGKGGKQRVVPVNSRLRGILAAHDLPASGPIFCRADRPDAALTTRSVGLLANDHLRAVGSSATLHQLRHWFGSRLYQATSDLRLVQELMGHASIVTTQGYAAIDASRAAGAVELLDIAA